MSTAVEQHQQHRRLLVALVAAVLALVVGVGVGVDAHASSPTGPVAESRVAAHELLAGPVVAAAEDVLAGEGRRTTTHAPDLAIGSRVALDSSTARALITEGPVSRRLEAQLAGCSLVMCQTAFGEFDDAVTRLAGPTEKAAADALATRLTIVPDNPSARAMGLSLSRRVGANDRVVFGTADAMGVPIYTSDVNFLRGAAAQGVWFDAVVHPPASPRGL